MKKALLHIILVATAVTSTATSAHWWRFNNFTNKILLLKVKLLASNNPYYAIVHPDSSVLFDWSPPNVMSGFCFDNVMWTEAPQEILKNRSLVNIYHQVINNKKMNSLFFGKDAPFTLNKADITFLPSQLYKSTVKAARSTIPFIDPAIKWFAKKYAESPCRSRNVAIIEDNKGEIGFYTLAH